MDNAFIIWLISNAFIILLISYALVPSIVVWRLAENRLIPKTYGIIAIFFFALLWGVIWALADVGWIPKVYGTCANAIAIFVTISGVVPLRRELKEIEERIQNLMTPLFIDFASEDKQLVEEIKDYFGKVETGFKQFEETLQEILKNCELENKEQFSKEIKSCLENFGMVYTNADTIGDKSGDTDQYHILLKNLKDHKVVITLYYSAPAGWVMQRIKLYKKHGMLKKIIVCTNKNEEVKEMLTKEKVGMEIVFSKQLDCEKLKSAIDKNSRHGFSK